MEWHFVLVDVFDEVSGDREMCDGDECAFGVWWFSVFWFEGLVGDEGPNVGGTEFEGCGAVGSAGAVVPSWLLVEGSEVEGLGCGCGEVIHG